MYRLVIGARVTYSESEECTHVLVDDHMPVKEDLIDAIVAKKPIVLRSWVEVHVHPVFPFVMAPTAAIWM